MGRGGREVVEVVGREEEEGGVGAPKAWRRASTVGGGR